MKNGDWIVKETEEGRSYPGRIKCVVGEMVIFEMLDIVGLPYEVHSTIKNIQPAKKEDFDKLILAASAAQIHLDKFIQTAYELQKQVNE